MEASIFRVTMPDHCRPEAPVISRDGQLWVYSYATKEADMKAHSYQAMVVQPKLAAHYVAPWVLP